MKTLQSNFTTPEQSKRLLELGLPADSADCYYYAAGEKWGWEKPALRDESKPLGYNCTPCWSVCRLMEIFDICFPESDTACWPPYYELDTGYITYVVRLYERGIMELDFSKLEE